MPRLFERVIAWIPVQETNFWNLINRAINYYRKGEGEGGEFTIEYRERWRIKKEINVEACIFSSNAKKMPFCFVRKNLWKNPEKKCNMKNTETKGVKREERTEGVREQIF